MYPELICYFKDYVRANHRLYPILGVRQGFCFVKGVQCKFNSWKKSTPTGRWQATYTKKATRSTSIWETRGLKIDSEYLSHLRFADDILICSNTTHELLQMLQELANERENQHSPSTATSSRVTLEHAWRDKSTSHAYFQQCHMVRIHGHSPPEQRTS